MSSTDPLFRVLIVCTGNTCRSPMAAAAMTAALGLDSERISVESAGTAAWEGQPATPLAVLVAESAGVDLTSHRSRRVTPAMVRSADLVLVMERGHLAAVRSLGADPDRTHVLSEWPSGTVTAGETALEVSDPFGASREAYEECWRRIQHHLERVLPVIREASRARSA
jgi:protein-tyrosine-phosphatase